MFSKYQVCSSYLVSKLFGAISNKEIIVDFIIGAVISVISILGLYLHASCRKIRLLR